MKKLILTICLLLISLNGHAVGSNNHLDTIWDNEYRLDRQIYIYQDDQFQLLNSDQEFSFEELTDQEIIYYPNLNIYIYTELEENNNIFGYLEIDTESQTKVEYSLELRVDYLNSFVDLSEPPALIVLDGSYQSGGKRKKFTYDTRTSEISEWLSQLNDQFRLDLKIRLWTKTGSIRSFTVGVAI